MAAFDIAYRKTIYGSEGGYNPGVDEAETYMGIDRHANPHWSGWTIIDQLKISKRDISIEGLNVLLHSNTVLQNNIAAFYKANYWDVMRLDKVKDQQLANNLFDCSVNQGSGFAKKLMQNVCNQIITSNKLLTKPLTIDLQIGNITLTEFNSFPPAQLMSEINAERASHYRSSKQFAVWGAIWLKRLIKYT